MEPRPRDDGKLSATDQHIPAPPYWRSNSTLSYASLDNSRPSAIRLEDHSEEHSEQSRVLWARHVSVDDYLVVRGATPGLGEYVVWNCRIETLDVRQLSALSTLSLGGTHATFPAIHHSDLVKGRPDQDQKEVLRVRQATEESCTNFPPV